MRITMKGYIKIFSIPATELKYAYTHDYLTGEKISHPENYRFKDF